MTEKPIIMTGDAHFQEFFSERRGPVGKSAFFPDFAATGLSRVDTETVTQVLVDDTLETRVFAALSLAKIEASRIAAHISNDLRKALFAALDNLHDVDEWEEGDQPLLIRSFKSYLTFMLAVQPQKWPSFGMTSEGRIFCSWGLERSRINIEFFENLQAQWSIVLEEDNGDPVRTVGVAPASSVVEYIAPFKLERWFGEFTQTKHQEK